MKRNKDHAWPLLVVETAERLGLRGYSSMEIIEEALEKARHHHRGRRRKLFIFLFSAPIVSGKETSEISREGVSFRMITSILSNDTAKGAFVAIAETDAAGKPVASSGPFAITVDDPSSLVAVTPGSPDNSTPTRIVANGKGGVGSVTVTVTDTSNTAKGSATLAIVAPPPPPPPVPALTVGFVPGT